MRRGWNYTHSIRRVKHFATNVAGVDTTQKNGDAKAASPSIT
jgi:hypothetical protein